MLQSVLFLLSFFACLVVCHYFSLLRPVCLLCSVLCCFFFCLCFSFLSSSLTLLYSSLTHWLTHCYYLYFPKCSSPPFFSLSHPPPFTLSTLSEGAIQINASALKVTTYIQLQGLFLNESHPRPCLSPHQGANHHLISGLRHMFPWAKDILNASMQT